MFVSKAYPSNYIQEPGILKSTGQWVKKFGKYPLIIAGPTAWSKAGAQISKSLEEEGIPYQLEMFAGHCSDEEVERLLAAANPNIDIVIGVGGGQCMDTTKYTGIRLNVPVVTVSTLASTCAASSALSIIYTPAHSFLRIENFDHCPILTLVDSDIIRDAPVRRLVAGIGDTIVKWYEAMPLNKDKVQNARTQAGLKMAELIRDLLVENSEQATLDCKEGRTSLSFRHVVDCNIYLAGFVGGLGQDTCASSGAHSIHNGMTSIPEIHGVYHGELVAYGLLCQFILEEKPEGEIVQMMNFYQKIGLPISLFDLGMTEINEDVLRKAAIKACDSEEAIHLLPCTINEDRVYASILAVHELGERVKRN